MDNSKIKIRKITIEDLEVIKELNKKLCVKEFNEFDDTIDPNYSMAQRGDEFFRNRIEGDGFAYVATDNEKIIGYFVGGINDVEDYRNPSKIGEGETTFIEENYRGDGIGTKFIRMFEEWCKEKGIKRLRIVASSRNEKAIKLYKREGFEEYDTVLEKVLVK
ncbi:GNAT family N-acetyltransferase [Patescibacteria group bacterium]|nr:GNAT family N-acetyltransferase [Patescibacteria group bacterium]MBU2632966.1 GNAT family N-acetyltransferase [Patescibacteria group bacterium]